MDYRTATMPQQQSQVVVNSFVRSVYNWMTAGLAITGGVAWFTAHTPALLQLIYGNSFVPILLFIATLGMVFALSGAVHKMKASTATGMFIAFSTLMGLSLSSIFIMYTGASIAGTFFITAGTFAACSIYGYTTKKDLTSMGGFMFMGLIGIIIASVVNWFLKSPALYWAITYIGVAIFVGLTAYDTQKIKNMALTMPADVGAGAVRKGAIVGALALYLDFINLFLLLLRIFGGGRD